MTEPGPLHRGLSRTLRFLPAFAIIVTVVIAYWPVLRGGWLWDDNTEITRNLDLRGSEALWKIWFAPSTPDYFPLKSTVQWLQWQLMGEGSTIGYHLTNILLHALAAFLFGRVLIRLGMRARSAWWGAVIFAVHPLAIESVAWIAEMKNVLSLTAVLLALMAFLDFEESPIRWHYIKSMLWFLAAMLCKSTVVMFPCFLLLFIWWKRDRISGRDIKITLPFFGIALALGLVTVWLQSNRAIGGWDLPSQSGVERVGYAGRAILFYAGKVLWPGILVPIYPTWGRQDLILGDLALFVSVVFIGVAWQKRAAGGRHLLLGMGWFGFNLVPVLGLLPMSYSKIAPVADHFAYLALAGGTAVIALGLDWVGLIKKRTYARLAPWFAAVICSAALVRSHGYACVFYDAETMWRYTVQQNPSAWAAQSNLATILLDQKKTLEAELHARAAVGLNPRFAPAQVVLGNACTQAGKPSEAIEHYKQALALEADSFEAHYNLANLLAQTQQPAAALEHYEAALRISPVAGDAHFNLANTLVALRQLPEALKHYSAALEANPRSVGALVNRGNVHAALGHLTEAVADFKAALSLEPASAEIAFALADALGESNLLSEALRYYAQAVQLDPNNPEPRRSYATTLMRAGRRAEAEEQYQVAIKLTISAANGYR